MLNEGLECGTTPPLSICRYILVPSQQHFYQGYPRPYPEPYQYIVYPSSQYFTTSQQQQQPNYIMVQQQPPPNYTFDRRRRSSLEMSSDQLYEDQHLMDPMFSTHSPLTVVTPVQQQQHHYSQQDFQELEQLRHELISENNRIRDQDARLKRQFDKYQNDLQKLQRDKAEVKRVREANKEEGYRLAQQREEVEYQRKRMEVAYVNVKRERSGVGEMVKGLEEATMVMKAALKDANLLKHDKRKADDLSLQLHHITQLLLHLSTATTNNLHSATSSSNSNNLPLYQDLSASVPNMPKNGGISQNHQSPPKVITDVLTTEEDEQQQQPVENEYEGVNNIEKLAQKVGDPKRLLMNGVVQQRTNANNRNPYQTNSDHHDLSTIMEREQLTTSQRRSSQDEQMVTALRQAPGQQQFFPPVIGTLQSNPANLGLSSDMINPDEENFNNNHFVTNQPMVFQRQHPLTATNRQLAQKDHKRILIPTTPTTVNGQQQQQQLEGISKERQMLEFERRECEERKNQLEGLYAQLHKELEDIQHLKQAFSDINSAAQQAAQLMNQSNVSHLTGAAHQSVAPFILAPLNDSRMTPAIMQTESELRRTDPIDSSQYQSAPAAQPFSHGFPIEQPPPRLQVVQNNAQNDDSSFDFTPDPDFLKKINQNMLHNDKLFNSLGQPVVMTKAAAQDPREEEKQQINIEEQLGQLYASQNQYREDVQIYDEQIMQQQYFENLPNQYVYEQEDENHLLLSQSDIQLMFPSAGGQPTYLILQNQSPNHMLLEMQTANNTSSQGQGDRKIEYIQDDFREDNEEEEVDSTPQDILQAAASHGVIQQQQISPIIGQQPMTSFAAALMSMQQNQEIAEVFPMSSGEQTPQNEEGELINGNIHGGEEEEEEDNNLYGTIKREIFDQSQSKPNHTLSEHSHDADLSMPLELIIKGKTEKLTDEEIQKLIDENYHNYEEGGSTNGQAQNNRTDSSVIYYNGKIYDEKKRAQYGIQRSKAPF